MTAPDLIAAVRPVLDALRDLGVRHYVGGSIASSAHGVARASIDADVVAELRPEHADRLCSAIVGAYYVQEARVREGIARKSSFNVIHLETMLKVDVFVSKGRPFDRRAMERARAAAPRTPTSARSRWPRQRTPSWRSWSGFAGAERRRSGSGRTCWGCCARRGLARPSLPRGRRT